MTATLTVDQNKIGRLLALIESEAHRGGWDGPPNLFLLYDADLPKPPYLTLITSRWVRFHIGPYVAHQMVPVQALQPNAVNALFRLALNLTYAADDPQTQIGIVLEGWRCPGFLGCASLHEAWCRTDLDSEQRKALGDVRFADMPGSLETRQVVAVDVDGGSYGRVRMRGKPATSWQVGAVDGPTQLAGAAPEALRVIVAAIAGQPLPPLTTTPSLWNWNDERTKR